MFRLEPSLSLMQTNENATPHFGAAVSARIKDRRLTLREVAAAADIPLTTLHRRLRAEYMGFTYGELSRLSRVLGTTAGALVTEFEKGEAA